MVASLAWFMLAAELEKEEARAIAARLCAGLSWSFAALETVSVRSSEDIQTAYAARNAGEEPAVGDLTFNVPPEATGK
jgi:cytochrome c oxidase assembly protein Cox11